MTIEEKAKAYDNAVNYAKEVLDGLAEDYRCTYMTKDSIMYHYSKLFPNEKEFRDDEDSFANRKLIYGLKSLLQQGKETFAGADIEDLIYYLENKKYGKIDSVTVNGRPVPMENNAVNITPRFKVGDIIRFKGDPPSAPNHKVRVVEGDKYYLDNDTVLYLPFAAQDKWDFAVDIGSLTENDDVKTLKIKKGFWYTCIKDVYREGTRAYSKGDIVKADNFMMSLDETSTAIAFRPIFFPYDFPEEFCRDISPATNRITFTEGELKVIKDIMGYLDYKGMEDYHDSLENLMLKYGGDEK